MSGWPEMPEMDAAKSSPENAKTTAHWLRLLQRREEKMKKKKQSILKTVPFGNWSHSVRFYMLIISIKC